jgi:hypothetical protein
MKKIKQFDCVEMKRRGSANVYEATKNLTEVDEISYWQQRTRQLQQQQQILRGLKLVNGSSKKDV